MYTLPPLNEMERAVDARDAEYDGLFVVAIRTTGIFCRPSCPARTSLRKNRTYFAAAGDALATGYRPCKRCRPLDANGRPPAWVTKLLALVERDPAARRRDAELREFGIDPARARRYFRTHYGMTFQAYCRARRMGNALQQIRRGARLDDVILDHGYDSHSGFRDAFTRLFGQPPGRGRRAGCLVTTWTESPIGPLLLGATDEGVCLLEFSEPHRLEAQLAAARRSLGCAVVPGEHEYLDRLIDQLGQYFRGRLTRFDLPLAYPGSPFQRSVWRELLNIPYGQTRSYEDIARAVNAPQAQRAVGRANGQNRIAIVIPCHRVVNKGGKLGGYGGGLWRKQFLLDLEKRVGAGL